MLPPLCERLETRRLFSAVAAALPTVLTGTADGSSIFIRRLDGGPIDPGETSWLIIHGWNSSPAASNMATLASAVQQARPNQQVLTLDWTALADTGDFDPFDALNAVPDVGAAAEQVMAAAGWNFPKLKVVAHSYGSYVGDEVARHVPGGIDGIIALDPGRNVNVLGSGFDPDSEIDFAAHAHFSWAFYCPTGTSIFADFSLGDPDTAATANESFVVLDTRHTEVQLFYANAVLGTDLVSQRFSLASFLAEDHGLARGPWRQNQWDSDGTHGGDYEAVIQTSHHTIPFFVQYVRVSDGVLTIENITAVGVAANGNLVVPGTLGSDTIVVSRPFVNGAANRVVVEMNGTAPQAFDAAHVKGVLVHGNAGNDAIIINVGVPPAVVQGNGGNDTILAGDAPDTLEGGNGNDSLVGGRADDLILGGPGDDTLIGGGGNDTIDAGAGNDVTRASTLDALTDPDLAPALET